MSAVRCHMSNVRCQVSGVKKNSSSFFFSGQSGAASRWRVCYQRGLPRLVLHLIKTCTKYSKSGSSQGNLMLMFNFEFIFFCLLVEAIFLLQFLSKHILNCFRHPFLFVEGLLSMGPTPSIFTSW